MPHALNLTLKLKKDQQTKALIQQLNNGLFRDKIQPAIDQALAKSELVHFARVLLIGDEYIQVITEYDGDKRAYTEFFRKELTEVFRTIFSMAENAPQGVVDDQDAFYNFSKSMDIRSLGDGADGDGYLFSSYAGDRTVRQLKQNLNKVTV